jgi:hypothetical protein
VNSSRTVDEMVKAHIAKTPKYPQTVHYTSDGVFMVSGDYVGFPEKFRPEKSLTAL